MPRGRSRSAARRERRQVAVVRRLSRIRSVVIGLGLAALVPALGCVVGLPFACALPLELLSLFAAAAIGSSIGLSIRIVRERKRPDGGR